ncbi:MAG: ATPase domain-containing protein [Methanomicrobiales archaeon]|nr:ATPase domain-containing protein [Methanomicrobiales archaeon]
MKKRRSTGIGGLDFLMDGGFPSGESIVVYGTPLTGVDLMARQFWQPPDIQEAGSYLMLEGEPIEGMIDARKIPLEELSRHMKGQRIVIDSLSRFIVKEGIERVLEFVKNDVRSILENDANVMMVLYSNVHPPMEEYLIMRATDIFVELRENILGNEIERTFVIHRIKGAAAPQRVTPFLISERGLELSTTTRVV